MNVGDDVVIGRAILDKDCRVGSGVRIVNAGKVQEADGPDGRYHIRDGIGCGPRGAVIPESGTAAHLVLDAEAAIRLP